MLSLFFCKTIDFVLYFDKLAITKQKKGTEVKKWKDLSQAEKDDKMKPYSIIEEILIPLICLAAIIILLCTDFYIG